MAVQSYRVLEDARQSCRAMYAEYFGKDSRSGIVSRLKNKLLVKGAFGPDGVLEQKMAVRAFFIRKHAEMRRLLESVEKARTEEEVYALGQEMQGIGSAMQGVRMHKTRETELFSFLQAAEIGVQEGAWNAEAFCKDFLPYGSSLSVRTGFQTKNSSLPIVLLQGSGGSAVIGSISIFKKSAAFGEVREDGKLLEFPTLPLAISYSPDGQFVNLGRLEMKATLTSEHVVTPEQFVYGLFYLAEKDFSKAKAYAEKFVRSHAPSRSRAAEILSFPFYSFTLRTPNKGEQPKLHLEASVVYTVKDYLEYSISVRMPGSRLYGTYMLPESKQPFCVSLPDCDSRR